MPERQPKRLRSKTEREIARYVRDGQWAFMERIQAVEKFWFCVWNKNGHHQKPYPPDLWVCCLMTGMDYLDWMKQHKEWFKVGRWSKKRYARPVSLTDAGRKALTEREKYDMEPINGGLCEPGFTVVPLPAKQRKRVFDSQYNTGSLK